jgi:hypothetical protein
MQFSMCCYSVCSCSVVHNFWNWSTVVKITNSMKQSPFWWDGSHSYVKEIPTILCITNVRFLGQRNWKGSSHIFMTLSLGLRWERLRKPWTVIGSLWLYYGPIWLKYPNCQTAFSENLPYRIIRKSIQRLYGDSRLHTDRQTDTDRLTDMTYKSVQETSATCD